MEIIDAFWEKDNLGLSCNEVILNDKDSLKDIEKAYDLINDKDYVVVKTVPKRFEINEFLESKGYHFIEPSIEVEISKSQFRIPESIKRMCGSCFWEKMNSNDMEELMRELEKGMFDTDRVFLDHYFQPGQASFRYMNWIRNMADSGLIPYKIIFRGRRVGFFIIKAEGMVSKGILGGVYNDYKHGGIGNFHIYSSSMASFEINNVTSYRAFVSGNNLGILRVWLFFGANIRGMRYVFVKHNTHV